MVPVTVLRPDRQIGDIAVDAVDRTVTTAMSGGRVPAAHGESDRVRAASAVSTSSLCRVWAG